MNKQKGKIQEGSVNKGGRNISPSSQRPVNPPVGQSLKKGEAMSEQRNKEEIINGLNNMAAFQFPETKTNLILREGIEAIIEVLCDIRDNINQKEVKK